MATALGNFMKATLLLIEDSKLLRAASARLLTNAGFTVILPEMVKKLYVSSKKILLTLFFWT